MIEKPEIPLRHVDRVRALDGSMGMSTIFGSQHSRQTVKRLLTFLAGFFPKSVFVWDDKDRGASGAACWSNQWGIGRPPKTLTLMSRNARDKAFRGSFRPKMSPRTETLMISGSNTVT